MEKSEYLNESQYEKIKKENVLSSLNHTNTIGFIKDGRGQRIQNASYKVGIGIPTSYNLLKNYEKTMEELGELAQFDGNYIEKNYTFEDYHKFKFLEN